jgi:hypothetical protein
VQGGVFFKGYCRGYLSINLRINPLNIRLKMSSSKSIDPKERIAIGKIASFFGSRYGNYSIDRIFDTLGIDNLSKGNKAEKIAHVLRNFYNSDKSLFVVTVDELIENHQLNPADIEKLRTHVVKLGFDIENGKLVQSSSKEIVTSANKPYDAFKIIEGFLLSAKRRINIIDPYVDHSLFTLYLDCVDKNVEIKILTKNMQAKFEAVARKFKAQMGNLEVKLSNDIHDRQIIVDDRAWLIGQSLKDAGQKSLSIVEYTDPSIVDSVFAKLWSNSKKIL